MPTEQRLPRWDVIGRGLVGRCPRCGGRGIFASVFDLYEDCPTCGLHFEREEGYWLGAVTVVVFVVLAVFAVVSVGGIVLFWPDVPWLGVTLAGVVVNGAIPTLGYGWAKSTWLGIEYGFNPPTAAEEADTIIRHAVAEAAQAADAGEAGRSAGRDRGDDGDDREAPPDEAD